jgi:16S rRNA (adenine1518-N6/adenine1519-N6)-dimethyltransferase
MASIRSRLAEHGLAPSKRRGQNFLRSEQTAQRLVELSGLCAADAAIEIGPGLGRLTRPIAAVARRTVALELDRGLVELLAGEGLPPSVEIRHEDALRADLGGIARELGPPVVLLGNLPYSIAGRLLAALLSPRTPFRVWGLMMQREVAARVLAEPGTSDFGPLAVWTRLWSRARVALELGPAEFDPRPQVHSSFLLFEPAAPPYPIEDLGRLRRVVRTAFQHRRKTLRAALRGRVAGADSALRELGIDPQLRPEALSELDYVRLANAIAAQGIPDPAVIRPRSTRGKRS